MTILNAIWGPFNIYLWGSLFAYSFVGSGVTLWYLHRLVHDSFYASSNLVAGLREGDYSMRLTSEGTTDALNMLNRELNLLSEDLRSNRLAKLEENRRFQLLIDLLEVAVIGVDDSDRFIFANNQARKWLGQPINKLLGDDIENFGLSPVLEVNGAETVGLALPMIKSRFLVHLAQYRDGGRACRLLLITDLKSPLKEEERRAWKSLIRVISHEVNNSITPISSLANSVSQSLRATEGLPEDKKRRYSEGLDIISNRSANMTRFIQDYAKLAKLPEPNLSPISVSKLLDSVLQLGWALSIDYEIERDCIIIADEAQLQQCLVNLIRNAIEAASPEKPEVSVKCGMMGKEVFIAILDNGHGISDTQNLFVPFFTTKPNGSGIGLALSQEIIEKHNGSLELKNRDGNAGCEACLCLPISS
ncbi:ATP-binding protein [Puniceicoccaceae bacterium K14]|nr:ATP-binding protein [Puniceicoccaceae bacterium K14]